MKYAIVPRSRFNTCGQTVSLEEPETHMQFENDAVQLDPGKVRGAFIVVVMITFLCFLPDLRNELLLWDDSGYIVDNSHIKSLTLDTISWAFTDFYANYWAPLTWLSLALDYALWGLNPVGYHLTNNILHALNAGMFFLLSLTLLTRYLADNDRRGDKPAILTAKRAFYCSLFAALYYSLHPLRVESVAWATERKDVLGMFLGIPAILFYLRHARPRAMQPAGPSNDVAFARSPYYWLTVVFFCLSLFAKPMFLTLPLILLALDWFPLKRLTKQTVPGLVLEKAPLFAVAGSVSYITMQAHIPTRMSFDESNMMSRVLIALKSLAVYLKKTVWPFDLSPFYLHPLNVQQIGFEYGAPILLFIIISICCVLLVRRKPVFLTVWLVYLMALLPFLGFTQSGAQAMADRLTYLPGMAVSMLAALGITAAVARLSHLRSAVIAILTGAAMVLLVNGYFTIRQIAFWKDDVTLWSRAIDLQPHSTGRAYFQRGYGYMARGEYDKALADLNEALTIANRKKYRQTQDIYYLRAQLYKQLGDYDNAIADYSSAIAVDSSPQRVAYYLERGNVYKEIGKADLADEDFRLAEISAQDHGMQ